MIDLPNRMFLGIEQSYNRWSGEDLAFILYWISETAHPTSKSIHRHYGSVTVQMHNVSDLAQDVQDKLGTWFAWDENIP